MSPSNRQQQQLSPSSPGQRSIDSDEALAARFQDGLLQAPYYSVGRLWDDYLPAYRFGQRSQRRHSGLRFDDVERQLEREWDTARGASRLGWVEARSRTPGPAPNSVRPMWPRTSMKPNRPTIEAECTGGHRATIALPRP